MLIVHLFVSYAHVNLCHFFSSWCRGLAAASACGFSWTFLFTFLFPNGIKWYYDSFLTFLITQQNTRNTQSFVKQILDILKWTNTVKWPSVFSLKTSFVVWKHHHYISLHNLNYQWATNNLKGGIFGKTMNYKVEKKKKKKKKKQQTRFDWVCFVMRDSGKRLFMCYLKKVNTTTNNNKVFSRLSNRKVQGLITHAPLAPA